MLCEAIYCAAILGGGTFHITEDYAPKGGYEWFNESLGIDIETKGKGFYYGGLVERFSDSFGKQSTLAVAKLGYRVTLGVWDIGAGLGGGYTKTSYYDGAVVSPYLSGCYKAYCADVGFVPDLGHNDSFVSAQFKIRF